jgi:hypothetical protein
LFDDIKQEINGDVELSALPDAIRGGAKPTPWSVVDGLILYKDRVYVAPPSNLRQCILEQVHGAGHEGVHKTLHRLRADFHIPCDRRVVRDFVRACTVCKRNKSDHLQPGGLLQPLGVPTLVWGDVTMDFVEALPRVNGKSVLLTVVDHFSNAAHFIPLVHLRCICGALMGIVYAIGWSGFRGQNSVIIHPIISPSSLSRSSFCTIVPLRPSVPML